MTTFDARRSRNNVYYGAARTTRNTKPTTTRNEWLRQVFAEQDRLGVTNASLAKMAGMDVRVVIRLRHPQGDGAGIKLPTFEQVRALAEAMDFQVPDRLVKNGD